MIYKGAFKEILEEATKTYKSISVELLKQEQAEKRKNCLGTLVEFLNERFSPGTVEEAVGTAEEYVTRLTGVLEVTKAELNKEVKADFPLQAADIFWKYVPTVLEKLRASSTIKDKTLDIFIAGLEATYVKPENPRSVDEVISTFTEFLSQAGQFYKPEEPVKASEIIVTSYDTLSPVSSLTRIALGILEYVIITGPSRRSEIRKALNLPKREMLLDDLLEQGLIKPIESKGNEITPLGLCSHISAKISPEAFSCLVGLCQQTGAYACISLHTDQIIGKVSEKALENLAELGLIKYSSTAGVISVEATERARAILPT